MLWGDGGMNNRLKECFCLVLGMAVLLMTGLNMRTSTAQLADKSKILVVVPHEDDDINMAGSVIATAVAKGKQVYVLFATNGDFTFKGATRIKEALAGLSLLGVKKKNVFFLGYGDNFNNSPQKHIFYSGDQALKAPSGHKETYGTKDVPDFCFVRNGKHHSYTKKNYCTDLENAILDIGAGVIFAIDYDYHADHRMLALAFDQVMGSILRRPGNEYFPNVYKGFGYATAFHAVKDFYNLNLLSTQRPSMGVTRLYFGKDDLIDNSIYAWKDRVRIPVEAESRSRFLLPNRIFRALCLHESQAAGLDTESVLNGDQVFWRRRTDSFSYGAHVQASSGEETVKRVNDFKLFDAKDIDKDIPEFNSYLWVPDKKDKKKTLTFTWEEAHEISSVKLYGSITDEKNIKKLKLIFDDGSVVVTGPMPAKGVPLTVAFPTKKCKECKVQIMEAQGNSAGIAECEFYGPKEQQSLLPPILKIMVKDNFVYDYILPDTENSVQLSLYRFKAPGPVRYEFLNGLGNVDSKQILHFAPDCDRIRLKVSLRENPKIYDLVEFSRLSKKQIDFITGLQKSEHRTLTLLLKLRQKYFREK